MVDIAHASIISRPVPWEWRAGRVATPNPKAANMNRVELKSESPHGAMATVAVNGHQIHPARVVLEVDAADITVACLKFPLLDGMDIETQARVLIDEPTRGALISMGWTPPEDVA